MNCDLDFVHRAVDLLAAGEASCWIFGGWAEELRGLCPARSHKDLDLLCLAPSFAAVERLLGEQQLDEIDGKRFPHKRAIVLDGVMVELFLVQRDRRGLFTNFWGRYRHDWPAGALSSAGGLAVASAAALTGYRTEHSTLQRLPRQPSAPVHRGRSGETLL